MKGEFIGYSFVKKQVYVYFNNVKLAVKLKFASAPAESTVESIELVPRVSLTYCVHKKALSLPGFGIEPVSKSPGIPDGSCEAGFILLDF